MSWAKHIDDTIRITVYCWLLRLFIWIDETSSSIGSNCRTELVLRLYHFMDIFIILSIFYVPWSITSSRHAVDMVTSDQCRPSRHKTILCLPELLLTRRQMISHEFTEHCLSKPTSSQCLCKAPPTSNTANQGTRGWNYSLQALSDRSWEYLESECLETK